MNNDFLFESKPMISIDNMGRTVEESSLAAKLFSEESPMKYKESAMVLLFNIEQRLRQHIANQIELKFHGTHQEDGTYDKTAHEIAEFVKNPPSTNPLL